MPSADRLERLTNQLVNMAEADMVAAIETTEGAYGTSRLIVVSFAVGSILLALGLGYIISWSLIEPVKKIEDASQPDSGRRLRPTGCRRQSGRAGSACGQCQPDIRAAGATVSGGAGAHGRACTLGRRTGGTRGSQQGGQFDARSRHGAEDDRGQGGSTVGHGCRHHLCVQQHQTTIPPARDLWDERRAHCRDVRPGHRAERSGDRRRRRALRARPDARSRRRNALSRSEDRARRRLSQHSGHSAAQAEQDRRRACRQAPRAR